MRLLTPGARTLVRAGVLIALAGSAAGAQATDIKRLWRKAEPAPPTRKARATRDSAAIVRTRVAHGTVAHAAPVDSVHPATPTAAPAVSPASEPAERLLALEERLREQALEIASLRLRLTELATSRPIAGTAVSATSAATLARVDSLVAAQQALRTQLASAQQRLSGLGNFRFGADVRTRYEHFEQGGGFIGRERNRTRARVSLTANASEEVTGGISLASGSLDDPQSPNQTSTGFFTRKSVGFDRFWVTYRPKWARPLTLTAGKFTSPWYRTSLSFGNDVNPEGIAGTWSIDRGRSSALQNVSVVSFMLPMNELAAGQDSYMLGGQVQARIRWSPRVTLRGYATVLGIEHPDPIAQAVATGTIKPSSATNTLRVDSTGRVLGYATGFRYTDVIGAVDIAVSPRLPLSVQFNWLGNTRASSENQAWLAEARLGRLAQARDVQGTWTMFHVQKDAVLSAFNEQDLRAATNVVNQRLGVIYQMHPNVALQFTTWLGHLIRPELNRNMVPAGARQACGTTSGSCIDPTLRRLQLDLLYRY